MNDSSPGTHGAGVIGEAAAAEERARVELLEQLLSPTGVAAVGFEAANRILDVIVGADRGDANVVLRVGVDAQVQRFATMLTAHRTVTLSAVDAYPGARFRIVRTGLGAFTLDIGGLKTIPASTAALVDVTYYEGTGWALTGYGTL